MMGNSSPIQWKKHIPLLGMLLLLFSAGPYINRSPWFDESLTLDWLVFPFYEIPFRYTIPNNHIFYTLCLSLWDHFLGLLNYRAIFLFRVLSLCFGCLAVCLIAKRMQKSGGIYAVLPVLILFAASGPMILFSTALRGYMLSMLFVFASFISAELWMKQNQRKQCIFYFVFSYFSVLTIPTNLLNLGIGLLLLFPLALRSKKDFFRLLCLGFLSLGAMGCAYLPILRKFLKVAQIKEGWYSYPDFLQNFYGTVLFLFLPLLIFFLIGLFRLPLKRKLRWRLFSFTGVFFSPAILGFLFQMPPFPRVFFPVLPFFVLIFSFLLSGFLRKQKGGLQKLPLIVSVIWLLAMPHILPSASKTMFGAHFKDDLLLPYPISNGFRPHKTVQILSEAHRQGRMEHVFIDFDADPPSLVFQMIGMEFPMTALLRDHPKYGPVQDLPAGSWIICRDEENFERVKKRFRLQQNYRLLEESADLYQKIYLPD